MYEILIAISIIVAIAACFMVANAMGNYNKFYSTMRFEKIQYDKTVASLFDENTYNDIKLPERATSGSAGYDFFAPYDITIPYGESVTIPTGIRAVLDKDKFLMICPRSGLGFKYGLSIANTVGVIDSDYRYSDNQGHIFVKLVNNSPIAKGESVTIKAGEAFCQGIIIHYDTVENDNTTKVRNGGFGSTSI